jgi:hypothetical protein
MVNLRMRERKAASAACLTQAARRQTPHPNPHELG